jgi:hypothetical protein
MLRSVGLKRARHVFVVAAFAVAPFGCTTYDGYTAGTPVEDSSSGHHDGRKDEGGCTVSRDEVCDGALGRDVATSDASRWDARETPDGAPVDQAGEQRPSDASFEIAEGGPSDASIDVDVDVDVVDVDVDIADASTADVSDVRKDTADAGDAQTDTADASDASSNDIIDVVPPPTFYRGINVGGSEATALVIDGQNWEAGLTAANVTYTAGTDAAGSGGFARITNLPLIPPTDANRTSMIQTFAWGRPIAFTMSNVPAGRYLVYMYTWEDNGAQTFDVLLQGQVVLASYNSGANGHWERLGPWPVDVGAGTIAITTLPTTGPAFANLCGVEIWRQ